MARCLQGRLRQDRRRVNQVVIVPEAEEPLDPSVLPAAAQERAVMTVIIEAREATVEVCGRPEEASSHGER